MGGCATKLNGGGVSQEEIAASLAELEREVSVIDLLTCILKEQRRTNAYFALITEIQLEDPETEV